MRSLEGKYYNDKLEGKVGNEIIRRQNWQWKIKKAKVQG